MKNILSEELKRYRELMNYDSKQSQGLLSESKNYLFEVHGKDFLTEEDRIRNMHLDAVERILNEKRVYRNIDFGPFEVTYTKTPSRSKGYKKTGTVDQYSGDTGQGSTFSVGKIYQSIFGKKVRDTLMTKYGQNDHDLVYNFMINGKKFTREQCENPKLYDYYYKYYYGFVDGQLQKKGLRFETINQVLKDEKIVTKKLIQFERFQQQLAVWEEIKKNDPAYAADIIIYVKYNDWVERVVLKRYSDVDEVPPEELVKGTDPVQDETEPTQTETEPTQTEGIPMMGADFGVSGSGKNNLYIDNCYKVDSETKTKIDEEIVQPILDVLANIPETTDNKKLVNKMMQGKIKFTWRGCVNSINVTSSASRFRNTDGNGCSASKLTFLELAKRRAENAKDYIIKQLITNKGMAWCSGAPIINLNYKGTNGDGTSGPNPPLNLAYYIPKGEYPMSPAAPPDKNEYNIGGKVVRRDECGAPLARKSDYDQFKYTIINVDAAFNFELMEPETPEVTEPTKTTTPEDKSETPGDEKVEPKVEVKSETLSYSADFYGEEEITEITRKLKFKKSRWKLLKLFSKRGVKMNGQSFIGRAVKTIKCNQPQ